MQQNYLVQQLRNIKRLSEDDFLHRTQALKKIIETLRSNGIDFAIDFSTNLFLCGIVTTFNDIDIAIHFYGDVAKLEEILILNGFTIKYKILDGKGLFFQTDLFLNCTYNGIQVEIFNADFEINNLHFVEVSNSIIPLLPIESVFVQYARLEEFQPEKRRYKRELIEAYMRSTGVSNFGMLRRAVHNPSLSVFVKQICHNFLTTQK